MNDDSLEEEDQHKSQGLSEALHYIKEACKIFEKEAERLRQEQETIDSVSKRLENFHFSSIVKLNVGGQTFETSLQTLTKDPNSMLAAMFSRKFNMKPAEDGAFFIDRDGTYFRFIINYLRTGKLNLPEGATFLKELAEEAEFYQIQGILDELGCPSNQTRFPKLVSRATKLFKESAIVTTEEHRKALKRFLPSGAENWHLLFQASRDGFKAKIFHSKCDDKGPTVTIVQSGDNIFGGFMEISWALPHRYEGRVIHNY